MSHTFPGYSPPPVKQKRSYQHRSKSEQVPRYPLLCRNPRNAVINKKHATISNAYRTEGYAITHNQSVA
jgi:hypothetical protein